MLSSKVKLQVASRNMNFHLYTVKELTREAVSQFNANEFTNYVEHVLAEERKLKDLSTLWIRNFFTMTTSDRFAKSTCLLGISLAVHIHNILLKMKSRYDNLFKIQFRVLVSLFLLADFSLFAHVLYDTKCKSAHCLFLRSMAGTKNSAQSRIAGIPAKSPRAPSSRNSEAVNLTA